MDKIVKDVGYMNLRESSTFYSPLMWCVGFSFWLLRSHGLGFLNANLLN
jgi:hypothetical protein